MPRDAYGCRKQRRGWSGGISVLVDESTKAGCLHDLEVSIWLSAASVAMGGSWSSERWGRCVL